MRILSSSTRISAEVRLYYVIVLNDALERVRLFAGLFFCAYVLSLDEKFVTCGVNENFV